MTRHDSAVKVARADAVPLTLTQHDILDLDTVVSEFRVRLNDVF